MLTKQIGLVGDSERGSIGAEALHRIGSLVRPVQKRLFRLLGLRPGDRCLDVGCGIGLDALIAADAVGAGGLSIGIDRQPAMVLDAERGAALEAARGRPRHGVAEAAHLPFADGAFDAVYTHRVLQHVTHPVEVVQEMVRVTRGGGRVAAVDCDWGTLTVDVTNTRLERRVVSALQQLVANPHAGRQLPRLFGDSRIADLTVEAHAVVWRDYDTFRHTTLSLPDVEARVIGTGKVSAEELREFLDGLAAAGRRSRFFATATLVVVAGTAL